MVAGFQDLHVAYVYLEVIAQICRKKWICIYCCILSYFRSSTIEILCQKRCEITHRENYTAFSFFIQPSSATLCRFSNLLRQFFLEDHHFHFFLNLGARFIFSVIEWPLPFTFWQEIITGAGHTSAVDWWALGNFVILLMKWGNIINA